MRGYLRISRVALVAALSASLFAWAGQLQAQKPLGTFDLNAYRNNVLGNSNSFGGFGNNPRLPQYGNGYNDGYNSGYNNGFNNSQPRNFWPQNNNNYNQPQNNYTRPVQPNVVRSQPAATVRSNAKPPEKIVATRNNTKPASVQLDAIDAESHALATEMVEQQADKAISDLEKKLGDASLDPAIATKLDELKQKIGLGLAITPADVNQFERLVELTDSKLFPQGLTKADVLSSLGDVKNLGDANHLLKHHAFPNGGLLGGLPTGPILLMPALPQDSMVLLPGGGMMMGMGGQGPICIADMDVREALDINIGVGQPLPDSDANVASRPTSGTYISNPTENDASINYVVSNNNYTMKPGYSQTLAGGKTWIIKFDRGQGGGTAEYKLSEGSYAFGVSGSGWDLFQRTFSVTIDNADNAGPFYCNIDNTQAEVPAGSSRTFKSDYPILVRFDRGSGGQPAQKRVSNGSDELVVAVNPVDGLWDLYPERNFESVARKSDAKSNSIRQALMREKLRLSLEGNQ